MTFHTDLWVDYYDKGYECELELLDDVMKVAGGNAFRAMRLYLDKLGRYDRHIVHGESDGQVVVDRYELNERPPRKIVPDSPTGLPVFGEDTIVGEITRTSSYMDLSCQIPLFLVDYLIGHKGIEAVVELGSGAGEKLIGLYYHGCPRDIRLYGAEYSRFGREMNQRFVDADKDFDVSVHPFDLRRPDLSFVEEKGHVLYFTSWSIMFVQHLGPDIFRSMVASADRVTGIHFEPCGFQISSVDYPVSRIQESEAHSKAWNVDLVPMLEALHNEGLIKLEYLAKDVMMGGGLSHPLTIAIWHKC